jgi:hypothetical protein
MSDGKFRDERRHLLKGAVLTVGAAAGALAGVAGVSAEEPSVPPALPADTPAQPEKTSTHVFRDLKLGGEQKFTEGRFLFDNCEIEGGGTGITIGGNAEVTLVNCEIRNVTSAGVFVSSTGRVQILNSKIHHCGENGIRVESANPQESLLDANVLIQGNHIHDIAAPWGDGATGNCVSVWKANAVQIMHNRCEKMIYSAIRIADGRDSMLVGNHCIGGEKDSQIYLEFAFFGSIVANNYFGDGRGGFEAVNFGGGHEGRQAIVIGNRFRNFNKMAVKIEADIVFAQNIVDTSKEWGVWGGFGPACRNLQIVDNLIMNCKWGVGVPTTDEHPVVVRGNRFFNVETPVAALVASWPLIEAGVAARPIPTETRHIIADNWGESGRI